MTKLQILRIERYIVKRYNQAYVHNIWYAIYDAHLKNYVIDDDGKIFMHNTTRELQDTCNKLNVTDASYLIDIVNYTTE